MSDEEIILKEITQGGFTEAKEAKSPSFFANSSLCGVSRELKEKLIDLGNLYEKTVRYCLHTHPSEFLHIMLIYHPYKKFIPKQNFQFTSSTYILLEGSFELEILQSKQVYRLDKENYFICKIPENTDYQMTMLSDRLLFMEIRKLNENTKKELQ